MAIRSHYTVSLNVDDLKRLLGIDPKQVDFEGVTQSGCVISFLFKLHDTPRP